MSTNNQTQELEFITLGVAESSKEHSLWVLNNSSPKGNINMTMNDSGGKMVLSVPVTWIPIDLTTQASRTGVLASPMFRRMVSMGMLKIVSDKSANAFMSSDTARKEAARVYGLARELTTADFNVPTEAKIAATEGASGISGFAMQLAVSAGMDEEQVLNTLRGNESTMTLADFKYLAERCEHPRVKQYCADKVNKG